MDSKAEPSRVYINFEPHTDLVQEEDCDTLLILLPGFQREQLRVQLTTTLMLRISGERLIGDNKWSKLQKEYPVSTNCQTDNITAKFGNGVLQIRQPKLITPVAKMIEEKTENETQRSSEKATEAPQPQQFEQKDKSNSGEKMETKDDDKLSSKTENVDEDGKMQKSRGEENKERKKDVDIGNDEKGKRKRDNGYENEDLMTGRVKMAKKMGRMMSVVVVVLSAIVLGIYVKNLIVPTKDYEN